MKTAYVLSVFFFPDFIFRCYINLNLKIYVTFFFFLLIYAILFFFF